MRGCMRVSESCLRIFVLNVTQVEDRPTSIDIMNDPIFSDDQLPLSLTKLTPQEELKKYKARFKEKAGTGLLPYLIL